MLEDPQEPVGALPDKTEIERVLVQDEVKLYRARCVIAYLDGGVYDFSDTELSIANPLPVYSDDMRQLGFASATLENGRVIADLAIDYACEERLLIESKDARIFPRVFGTMSLPQMLVFDFQVRLQVLKLDLHGIKLTRLEPVDDRLSPVGTPVL